ncbi:hypothetical protein LSH36_565g01026 [Paralvinella palmiformis]|uniref:Transmembrane protein 17 n=1 Tax=Paralvinella palmiformis TaxID=53620 RepID=A0AAD9MXA7_9ANNE|nr:hypothetical protein LSH36_565g01026 [Paralvinella palmiformis]
MADRMRNAVTSVTNVVFPPSKSATDPQQQHLMKSGLDYVSSLPLQMALYFNVFYYPLWLITCIVGLQAKYEALSVLYKIIIIAILVVMTVVEIIRLSLGYIGNLTEKVPELAGFWLLTLLLQTPLSLFLLLNEDTVILPLERAVHIILVIFVIFEVFMGYFAIRALVNHQVTKFHLQQFTNLEEISSEEYIQLQGGYRHEHRA